MKDFVIPGLTRNPVSSGFLFVVPYFPLDPQKFNTLGYSSKISIEERAPYLFNQSSFFYKVLTVHNFLKSIMAYSYSHQTFLQDIPQ